MGIKGVTQLDLEFQWLNAYCGTEVFAASWRNEQALESSDAQLDYIIK